MISFTFILKPVCRRRRDLVFGFGRMVETIQFNMRVSAVKVLLKGVIGFG